MATQVLIRSRKYL